MSCKCKKKATFRSTQSTCCSRINLDDLKCSDPNASAIQVEQWEGEPEQAGSTLINSVGLDICGKLQLWSVGSIDLNIQQGSARVKFEANNMLEGIIDPIDPPANPDLPAIYCNIATGSTFMWDTTVGWRLLSSSNNVANTYVFQPGGTANGNVYTDWSLLIADHSPVNGPKIIELDDRFSPITIPAGGPYDMRDTRIQGRYLAGIPTVVTIAPGAQFTNLEKLEWLRFNYNHSTPAMVVSPGLSYFRMWGSVIQNNGSAPFFDVTTPGAILLTQFENASGFNPFGGTPVADLGSSGFMSFGLDEASSNGVNTVTGSGSSRITVAIRDASSIYEPIVSPTFTGTVISKFLSKSNVFVYRPGETIQNIGGNLYNSWEKLKNDVEFGAAGHKIIQIDDSIVSPAIIDRDTDLSDVTLSGRLGGVPTQAQIADGVVLSGLTHITDTLSISTASSTPPITIGTGDVIIMENGSIFAGPNHVVQAVVGTGSFPFPTIRFLHGSGLSTPGSSILVKAGAFLVTQWGSGTSNSMDSISGEATARIAGVILNSSTAFENRESDAGWLGLPWIYQRKEDPEKIKYDAAGGVWNSSPDNLKDAIDRIAAALNGLLDGSIPPGSIGVGIP